MFKVGDQVRQKPGGRLYQGWSHPPIGKVVKVTPLRQAGFEGPQAHVRVEWPNGHNSTMFDIDLQRITSD